MAVNVTEPSYAPVNCDVGASTKYFIIVLVEPVLHVVQLTTFWDVDGRPAYLAVPTSSLLPHQDVL